MTYHIGQFDGPLDVLLSLISKNKIDIFDIPISLICDQYIDFIENSGITDMELLGEFLTMACRLKCFDRAPPKQLRIRAPE